MVTALALLGVLGVLFVAAVLATREGGELAPAPPDVADLALPTGPLAPEDLAALRFPMAVRGYRMDQVDAALQRLADELRDRDRRIGLLEAAAAGSALPGSAAGGPLVAGKGRAAGGAAPVRQATPEDLPLPPTAGPGGAPPPGAGH